MIVVIADDLTGAAELAGEVLDQGLTAEVQTRFDPTSKADVVAIDTDTRWRSPEDAVRIVKAAARAVFRSKPSWVYKKTDSVLRGNVRIEIEAIVEAGNLRSALLVPANPSRGRVIRGGEYFVQGVPLEQTAFAHDPEYPRRTARVSELLGPSELIRIPDTSQAADLQAHAESLDAQTLPAGGVDFFAKVLALHHKHATKTGRNAQQHIGFPALFVCGSSAGWQQGRQQLCERLGIACLQMPQQLTGTGEDQTAADTWAEEIRLELGMRKAVLIAIGNAQIPAGGPAPYRLAARLARVVARVASSVDVGCICAEGGAMARAVVDQLGWKRMYVLQQWAPGVVEFRSLRAGRPTFVCKVGSYEWPPELLKSAATAPGLPGEPVQLPIDGVLDLHTFRPEALGELIPEYLAQCQARGISEVRIIHGKGIGNLKRSVQALLKRLPEVDSFASAGSHFGGAGATMVTLRKRVGGRQVI